MATDIIARGMASKSGGDVKAHTDNNDIHVTASDKSNWNNKANKSDVYTKTETDTLLQKKASTIKKTTVTLSTSWSGSSSPYTQTVTISGITANSKVDLQPDAAVIQQMVDDEVVAINIVNNNGALTAYAVGEKPTAQMVVQATITEVSA